MDFYIDPTEQYRPKITKRPGKNPVMHVLEAIFDPFGTTILALKDCVLISLDTEYDIRTSRISQLGITSLDTRLIPKADDQDLAKHILVSRLFLFQRQSRRKGMYLFGRPEYCDGMDMKKLLLSMFTIPDSTTGKPRNVVLVGHGVASDMREINKASGFSLQEFPNIKAVVDTSPLVFGVYHTSHRNHSLRHMCKLLHMYRRNTHTAGNDAMYTMKALLLLFCNYKEEKQLWNSHDQSVDERLLHECHLSAIRAIGRCNNGICRFKTRRARPRREFLGERSECKRREMRDGDLLNTEEAEKGIVDSLFGE